MSKYTIKVRWLDYTYAGDVFAEWIAELCFADGGEVAAPVFMSGPEADSVLRTARSVWGADIPALIFPRVPRS